MKDESVHAFDYPSENKPRKLIGGSIGGCPRATYTCAFYEILGKSQFNLQRMRLSQRDHWEAMFRCFIEWNKIPVRLHGDVKQEWRETLNRRFHRLAQILGQVYFGFKETLVSIGESCGFRLFKPSVRTAHE